MNQVDFENVFAVLSLANEVKPVLNPELFSIVSCMPAGQYMYLFCLGRFEISCIFSLVRH